MSEAERLFRSDTVLYGRHIGSYQTKARMERPEESELEETTVSTNEEETNYIKVIVISFDVYCAFKQVS